MIRCLLAVCPGAHGIATVFVPSLWKCYVLSVCFACNTIRSGNTTMSYHSKDIKSNDRCNLMSVERNVEAVGLCPFLRNLF